MRSALRALVPSLALAAAACGSSRPAVPTQLSSASGSADVHAKVQRWMNRENGPFPTHALTLWGGLATGRYEAAVPAKPDCHADRDGDSSCAVRFDLGADEDGAPYEIHCFVDTTLRGPFGTVVAHRLDGAGLSEAPQLAVSKVGDGLSAVFVANTWKKVDGGVSFGTVKVAALYAKGYSATCSDVRPGGRATFARITSAFFGSLRFADNPRRPALFAQAYTKRKGEQTNGFRYALVEKRLDGKPGAAEIGMSFHLETDGKSWQALDYGRLVTRGPSGDVELYRESVSDHNGVRLGVLTAKPSEGGRYRLKLEHSSGSEALEATPKAPLTTELWSSAELALVARGARPGYRYAVLDVHDGEPQFKYINVTRSAPGILLEEEEAKGASEDALAAAKDELHVDANGVVTKEVSSKFVAELVAAWGKLPAFGAVRTAAAPEKRTRAAGKGGAR